MAKYLGAGAIATGRDRRHRSSPTSTAARRSTADATLTG